MVFRFFFFKSSFGGSFGGTKHLAHFHMNVLNAEAFLFGPFPDMHYILAL